MSDSDRPLIIGSGTKHSVSVSEHTGNANSPKNKVRSGFENKSEKVAINDKGERAGKTPVIAEQRQNEQLAGNLILKAAISEKIQTATKGINKNNSQKIESEALNKLSAQGLNNDIANEILDGIYNTSSAVDKNVKVNIESIKENIKAINIGIDSENIQEISFDKALESNTIKISDKLESQNKAKILTDKDIDNLQTISNEKHEDSSEPKFAKESSVDNAQEINLDKQENNKQKLSSDVVSKTTKAVVVESVVDNLQKVPKEKESVNVQVLHAESKSKSDNPILSRESNKNTAQLEGVNDMAKFHTPTEPRGVDNSQPIVKVEREENRQLIDTPHSEPYIQPEVRIKITEENKQPVAKVGVQDHTERLPTDKNQRSNIDISAAPALTDLSIGKVKKPNPQSFKNDEKLDEIKLKVNAINNAMETVNLQLDALGPIKEIPTQSLREKQHEAFLGRVARMKGDVASVNQQLNVLEEMAGLKSKSTG